MLKWPKKLKGDQNKRSKDKYSRFHRDHGNDTSNCYELKSQIKALIKKGKLQRFVRGKIDLQPPQGTEHPRRVEERPRATPGEIKVIVGGSTLVELLRHQGEHTCAWYIVFKLHDDLPNNVGWKTLIIFIEENASITRMLMP